MRFFFLALESDDDDSEESDDGATYALVDHQIGRASCRETCEVLLYYPKIGGYDVIEDYVKKDIRNLLRANIDVHSRRFIDEFP